MFKFTSAMCRMAFVALMAVGASAAYAVPSTSPSGTIDLVEYPAGLSGITINGKYSINRECAELATLRRGDVVIRQIPASNYERIITGVPGGEGYEKTEIGNLMFFLYSNSLNPATQTGEYTFTVPAGYAYYDGDKTKPTEEWEFKYTLRGGSSAAAANITVSPAADKTYQSLQTFTLTLPNNEMYRFNPEAPKACTLESLYGEAVNDIQLTATIVENMCILRAPETVDVSDTYQLTIPAGFYQVNTGSVDSPTWTSGTAQTFSYYIKPLPKGIVFEPNPEDPVPYFKSEVKSVVSPIGKAIDKYVLFTISFDDTYRLLLRGVPKIYAADSNGNATGDALMSLSVDRDIDTTIKNKLYVCSQSIVQKDSEGKYDTAAGDILLPPGEYVLVIPNGCFSLTNGGINAEFQCNYTVSVNDKFQTIIKPANGSKQSSLQYITVAYDEGMEISCAENAYAHLTNGIAEYALVGKVNDELLNEIEFSLPIPMTTIGEWQFTTPSSGYTVNGSKTSMNAVFYVSDDVVEADKTMVVDPAAGVVEQLKVFHVTFPGAPNTWIGQEGGAITLSKNGTDLDINSGISKYYDETNGYFIIELDDAITEAGTYVLSFAPQTFWVGQEDGFASEAASFTYVIEDAAIVKFAKPAINPDEATDLSRVKNFILTLADGEVATACKPVTVDLHSVKNGNRVAVVASFIPTLGEDGKTINLESMSGAEVVLPIGDYELVIPGGVFSGENAISAEYVYNFKCISSVDTLFTDEAPADLFNAAGMVIKHNVTPADLNGLDKGLYIYKGRKLIVK
ncbi:MAG: hypothetical protein NC201_04460 [Prevotella sp.]|nr:hypothetical protein [Bacteroides sp.]MCM1366482.1 hypothetical protein [Prevotella sp.]MCM1436821.1 hypothetical protein [Prevotella sp.]